MKNLTKMKMSALSRMSRRQVIRNSVRVSAPRALSVDHVRLANRVSPVSRENLANLAAANGLHRVVSIVATAARVNVCQVNGVRLNAVLATLIVRNVAAANAAVVLALIEAATVVIAVNVRRCANAPRWTGIVVLLRARIAVDADLLTGIVVLAKATADLAKIVQ